MSVVEVSTRWSLIDERLKSRALEAAANGIVVSDREGIIVWVNPAVTRMTGFAAEDLIGRHTRVFKSGEQPASFYRDLWRTILAGETWHGSLTNRRMDGSTYIEEMTIAPISDDWGEVRHFVAIKQDVTERHRLSDELEQSEAWWRAVLENGMDLVGVDDPNGTFRYLSPSVKRILGYEPEELMGTVGFDLVHPEDADRIRRSFAAKTNHKRQNEPVVMRFRHKDGSWRVMEAISKNALDDPHVRGMIVNARDVTDRVEVERHRALLESVVVSARDGIVVMEADPWPTGKKIVYANPAYLEMTGYSMPEILGKNPREFQGEPSDPAEVDRIRSALERGEAVRAAFMSAHKSGKLFVLEMDVAPIQDSEGRITHFVSIQRDITERREQEHRVELFQEFRRRLALLADDTLGGSIGPEFFRKILEYAIGVVPGAEAGSLLVRKGGGDFQYAAVHGFDSRVLAHALPRSVAFAPATERNPIVCLGYDRTDWDVPSNTVNVLFGDGVRTGDIAATLKVPIWIDDELRAVFNLDTFSATPRFSVDDVEMGRLFGRQVGVILQRLDLEALLVEQSTTDPLTGLPNRRGGEELLNAVIGDAADRNELGGFCLLDVDNFKVINDAYGHAVGDAILKEIGKRIKAVVTACGTVARWSGDEFMVICPDVSSEAMIVHHAQQVLDELRAPIMVEGAPINVGISIGIVPLPAHGRTVAEAIQNAHIALHHAKRMKTTGFAVFSSELRDEVNRRTRIEIALRDAVATGNIVLHYQPRVDLRHDRVTSVEALARWTDEQLGVVSPAEFIPIAEETELIFALGRLVLDQACRQAKVWLGEGVPRVVAVNLSVKQLQRGNLVADVREALERHGLDARWLELEITESAAMTNVDTTLDALFALHELGVTLSIDDFGTAYSSLAHLKMMPIHALKIDRGFVMDLGDDPSKNPTDAAIIQAIIALGKSMNLKVIAEGVETQAQKNFLKFLGCDEGQGYLWSKPVPAHEL